MKAYIITLFCMDRSRELAERAAVSCKKYNIDAELFEATAKDFSRQAMKELGLFPKIIENKYGNIEAVYGCFLSHYRLWTLCVEENKPIIVLEHDAIIVSEIPNLERYGLVNIGAPSYGRHKQPKYFFRMLFNKLMGRKQHVLPLFSKHYLPGTHAYSINPRGAQKLINFTHKNGVDSADLFLNIKNFPFIKELHPWCAIADADFSTVQNEEGLAANHSFQKATKENKIFLGAIDSWK